MKDIIEIFEIEKTCKYRGEVYRVRDNGAVYRLRKPEKRKRPLDEIWRFGKSVKHGYLAFSSEAVHRIVATAFHKKPSERHIVDHIDTNKKNNRPDNLRWVTRLENILLNPITLRRIISRYGSIDNFFKNQSKTKDGQPEQGFDWMRPVTKEESENTKKNLMKWAKEGKIPTGGQLGEWIFLNMGHQKKEKVEEAPISIPPIAIQKDWKTPSEFPNCPISLTENTIKTYKKNLKRGTIFCKNIYDNSITKDVKISKDGKELYVLTKFDDWIIKPYALAVVYIENEKIVHHSIGTFFKLIGAQKQMTLGLGLEWTGEDSIDDYA